MEMMGRTAEVTEVVKEEGPHCDVGCRSLSHKGKTWVSSPSGSQE